MKNRIVLWHDDMPENPRDWSDPGSRMACWHKRYELGDEQPDMTPDEWLDSLEEGTVILPLYLYDHSGITISTAPFSCPWDSGQIGYIVMEPSQMHGLMHNGVHVLDLPEDERKRAIEGWLEAEVETYDQYLRGDVWGFTVDTPDTCPTCENTDYDILESCGGFFGTDWEKNGVLDYVEQWFDSREEALEALAEAEDRMYV